MLLQIFYTFIEYARWWQYIWRIQYVSYRKFTAAYAPIYFAIKYESWL